MKIILMVLWILIGVMFHLNNLRMIRNKIGSLELFDLIITIAIMALGPFAIITNLFIWYIHSDFEGKFFKK
jgi:hypothetical protein